MSTEDIIDLLSLVAAADHRTVGENDVILWREILKDTPKDLAMQAILDHIREHPGVWLEPGHVVAGVRAIRRDRYERLSLDELAARQDAMDARLASKIYELAETKSVHAPTRRPRLRVVSSKCTSTRLSETVRQVRTTSPPTRLTAAEGDPLMCGACGERELADQHEADRGVCDPCWDTART
jgi:hypothetical protein